MPRFSAFSAFGQLEFSGSPSVHQKIYTSLSNLLGGQYDLTVGGHAEASLYARSRAIARAQQCIRRAGNQQLPMKCLELLPQQEASYGLVPSMAETTLQRQQALAARMQLPGGAVRTNLVNALSSLLGSSFVELRTLAPSEAAVSEPTSNFARLSRTIRVVSLVTPVVLLGSPSTVTFGSVDPTIAAPALVLGDVLTVQPENTGLCEVVTVTGVTPTTLTATFTKAHDIGAVCTTQNWPRWISSQRTFLVVVTSTAAINAVTRRAISDLMNRICPGPSTWEIVQKTGGALGPLTLNVSPLGTAPLGVLPL